MTRRADAQRNRKRILHAARALVGEPEELIRADAEARDVIVLIGWLSRLDDAELDARGSRLQSILVDGLRARDS